MTKADIINKISASTGLAKKDIATTVESFMEVIKDSLLEKENVYLRGFGSLIVKHHLGDSSSRLPKLQACQELRKQDEGRRCCRF